jgi:hypothetical protein
MWCRQVEKDRQVHFREPRLDRVAKSDVDQDPHLCAVNGRRGLDAEPSIFGVVANAVDRKSLDVEDDR